MLVGDLVAAYDVKWISGLFAMAAIPAASPYSSTPQRRSA
jgi:hypothetical protein